MFLKFIISIVFISVFFTRIIKPELNIDTNSIILLVLAVLPWFIKDIKTLEINGVGKVELFDKERQKELDKKASDAGIIKSNLEDNEGYVFYGLRYSDSKLALAGMRIEIESVLKKIAAQHKVNTSGVGLVQLTRILNKEELITDQEQAIIFDLIGILNQAVHSQLKEYDSASFDHLFELGLDLLKSLNNKLV